MFQSEWIVAQFQSTLSIIHNKKQSGHLINKSSPFKSKENLLEKGKDSMQVVVE